MADTQDKSSKATDKKDRNDMIESMLAEIKGELNDDQYRAAARKVQELSRDLSVQEGMTPMSKAEVLRPNITKGSSKPSEFIAPYYGDKFDRELINAARYNEKSKAVIPSSYARMFDVVDFERGDRPASYSPEEILVRGPDETSMDIMNENLKTLDRWSSNTSEPRKAEIGKAYFKDNSLDPNLPDRTVSDIMEHEYGHHVFRPSNKRDYGDVSKDRGYGLHTGDPMELAQGLGRLQREVFKGTGKRLESEKDFMDLVSSDKTPEYLSQEGQRVLSFARRLKQTSESGEEGEDKESAKKALKFISDIAPSFLKREKDPETFLDSVNKRIGQV